ncbi:hypothetical protein ECANGB1_2208 [Enterospora canceri]|uniref:Uncharacterized protein n=1 Tax=Enterospora canceri TaxID=1081671 RepID=A0A1Y1S5K1_9MICR|nr:hypothetical protein ECANGB1_2208 [Enterospora canceri]
MLTLILFSRAFCLFYNYTVQRTSPQEYTIPYNSPRDVNQEYSTRFIKSGGLSASDYSKKLVELLRKPITGDGDPMLSDELFKEGTVARGIADPTHDFVVTEKMTNDTLVNYLNH